MVIIISCRITAVTITIDHTAGQKRETILMRIHQKEIEVLIYRDRLKINIHNSLIASNFILFYFHNI